MRTAPGVRFTVVRFRLWNLALLGLATGSAAIVASWIHRAVEAPWAWPAAVAGVIVTVALAAPGFRRHPQVLHSDGQVWRWGPAGGDVARLPAGRVEVCIDLQFWLLLRLWPNATEGGRRAVAWLPVERQGTGRDWHALRCAVYSASTLADVAASENRLTA